MTTDTSFKAYIQKRRITDTPEGDFVSDARRDSKLPDVKSLDELLAHIFPRGGSHIRPIASRVWRQYEAWRAKQRG